MTDSNFTARVYSDGRICITPSILRYYASLAGKSESALPKSIWLDETENSGGTQRLTWKNLPHAAKYDLSVRDRLLWGRFNPGAVHKIVVGSSGIYVFTKPLKNGEVLKRSTAKRKRPKRVRRADVIAGIETEFDGRMLNYALRLLQQDFLDVTIKELAGVMPDMTIGELMTRQD